ncbi:MAG: DUF4010 domain-containing protein [Acidobacteriota bacterium]
MHSWIAQIPDVGLRAGFRFALMALVILPLLPEGPYGPFSIRPQELWAIVLLFSGISFAAFVVRSILGPRQGYLWAGALGGMISSTNVTLTFARLSRADTSGAQSLALGAVAASTVLNIRVLAASAILNPQLAVSLLPYLAGPAILGVGFLWFALRNPTSEPMPSWTRRNRCNFVPPCRWRFCFKWFCISPPGCMDIGVRRV